MEITYFTPGEPTPPGLPLAHYRPATPAGALAPYLEAYTRPGDLVIDLFCQGPLLVREAVQAGRRALGLNVNRALLLSASVGLADVQRQEVEAAFSRLARAPTGPETLQARIAGFYRTTCPACGAQTSAAAFVWERGAEAPAAKRYHCPACGIEDTAPTDEADQAAAARFEARGMSYWLLLDRAAPADAPYRERMASLLELAYTPRNLTALSDLLRKSDGLTLSAPARHVLDALLLDTLDRSTNLRPPDALHSRPRRLRRPSRYVEPNVWHTFECALQTWRATPPTPLPLAPSLDSLIPHSPIPNPQYPISAHLTPLSARQAGQKLPPACAALIVADPPRPDLTLWRLTALWSHWLWGRVAGAPLAPFLSRRWTGQDQFWRGVYGALRAAAPLLRPGGRVVGMFADEDPAILEALLLAAAGAGCELLGWGTRPPQARLTWRVGDQPAPPLTDVDQLSRAVAERAAEVSQQTLRLRGEPLAWPVLHSAIYASLAESGLLAQAAALPGVDVQPLDLLAASVRAGLDGAPLRQIPAPPGAKKGTATHLWWLAEALEAGADSPLSDRVELAVAAMLRDSLALSAVEVQRRVCASFPGPQTPEVHLVRLCLFSYGDEHAPGYWRLRAEDTFEARVAETDAVIADLGELGRKLGFEVSLGVPSAGEWAVCWLDEEQETDALRAPFAFVVRTTARLSDLWSAPVLPAPLRARLVAPETTPCLTLPGGRAVLVGYKLRRDPRLSEQVGQRGWQFLKFRHLRRLAREAADRQLDRYAFRAALGLDPIVEQGEAQMSLW